MRRKSGEKLNKYRDLPSQISRNKNSPKTASRKSVRKSVSRPRIALNPDTNIIIITNKRNIQL